MGTEGERVAVPYPSAFDSSGNFLSNMDIFSVRLARMPQYRLTLMMSACSSTQMNCGPHSTASSPYHYIQEGLQAGPKWLWDLTYYATVPATTMSFIIASLCIQMYFASANQSMQAKVNSALNTYVSEMHDKKQLLRANGIKL